MVYKNQNYMTNRKIKKEIDKNQKGYEAEETPVFEPELYYFVSYADAEGETYWGNGTVETTGVTEDGYTQVEIKTNDPDQSFVGQKVFLVSDANANGQTVYPVYSDAGKTSMNLYVKVSKTEITVEEPKEEEPKEEEPKEEEPKVETPPENPNNIE